MRQAALDELTRLREDVVGPVSCPHRFSRFGKSRPGLRVGDPGQRRLDAIGGGVLPDAEVIDLGSADAGDDPQHLEARHLQRQRRCTGSTRPARSSRSGTPRCWRSPASVPAAGVRRHRRLHVRRGVTVVERHQRLVIDRHRLPERGPEVRVQPSSGNAGTNSYRHCPREVREPQRLLGGAPVAWLPGSVRNGRGSPAVLPWRRQIRIEERRVAALVAGVAGDVGRHVSRQCSTAPLM